MPNSISSVKDYRIKSGDEFFFDNNIWMYLLCSIGNYQAHKQKAYSKFLQYIEQRGNPLFTNALVLSEFSNRYLKLDYDILRKSVKHAGRFTDYKKDFVGCPEYKSTIADIKIQLRNILKICRRCSDEFNSINMDDILNVFTGIGFNDSYYIHLSKKKNWIIVSDDSDFSKNIVPDCELKILTY